MVAESTPNTIPTAERSNSVSVQSFEKSDGIIPKSLEKEAQVITASGNVITKDGLVVSTEDSDKSLSGNIFADTEVRDYYAKLYEDAKYECRHEFDADATWTEEEEKAVVRKLDWRGKWRRPLDADFVNNVTSVHMGLCHVLQFASRSWQPRSSCRRYLAARLEADNQW
jgi:hypothetical protein